MDLDDLLRERMLARPPQSLRPRVLREAALAARTARRPRRATAASAGLSLLIFALAGVVRREAMASLPADASRQELRDIDPGAPDAAIIEEGMRQRIDFLELQAASQLAQAPTGELP